MGNAIVLNTSPTLALVAALGSLDFLGKIYQRVLFSETVAEEIHQAGHIEEIAPCLARMRTQGIWLSADLQAQGLLMAGEIT